MLHIYIVGQALRTALRTSFRTPYASQLRAATRSCSDKARIVIKVFGKRCSGEGGRKGGRIKDYIYGGIKGLCIWDKLIK